MSARTMRVCDSSETSETARQPSTIETLFDPLIKLFFITGSYSTLLEYCRTRGAKHVTCKSGLHLLYCLTLVVCLWFEFIRYTYQTNTENQDGLTTGLSKLLSVSTILFAYSIQAVTTLWTLSGELRKTALLFTEYEWDFGLRFDTRKLKRQAFKTIIALYICFCPIAIVFPFILTVNGEDSYFGKTFFSADLFGVSLSAETPVYIYILVSISGLIAWGKFVCYASLHVLLCYIICKELNGFHQLLAEAAPALVSEEDIEEHRFKFERTVRLVNQINACLYHGTAIHISSFLAVVCFLLYGVVQENMQTEDLVMSTAFVFKSLVTTVVLVGSCIATNHTMHAPLETLYSLNLCKMSEKAVMQVSIFINRLSSHPLGISVYGFFVVEKSTVLMIFGTILTYFVVMIQMQPSSRDAPSAATLNATQA